MTAEQFQRDVDREIARMAERGRLQAEIDAAKDDVRQLRERESRLNDELVSVWTRKIDATTRLMRAEVKLDALARSGVA